MKRGAQYTQEEPNRVIVVHGTPGPQGSKRLVGRDGKGRGILVEQCKSVKPWRECVKWAALSGPLQLTLSGPIRVEMIFTLKKPASAPKKRQTWPDRTPDLSKLVRSTEDALTQVGVWEDDARIVDCMSGKRYPGEGEDALDVPGVVVRVWRVK